MFSEIAHQQQNQPQHQFPHPSYSIHDTGSNNWPSASLPISFPTVPYNTTQNGSFRQRLDRPQQYACPLRSTLPLPQQLPIQVSYASTSEASEHMLRRKTPNGTLAAGYDGSPVEWTKRPHAMKHFLMPTSNETGHTLSPPTLSDEYGERPPPHKDYSFLARTGDQQHSQQYYSHVQDEGNSQGGSFIDSNKASPGWRSNGVPPTGLDSVLNQSSLHHHHYNLAGSQNVPTVLQPMWPPCLGPTSIHNHGPYGPYWPDGAFEPYRPAPLRDPRFQYQATDHNADISAQLHPAVENYGQWLQTHSVSQCSHVNDQLITSANPFPEGEKDALRSPDSAGTDYSNKRYASSNSQNPATPHEQFDIPPVYCSKPSSWEHQGAHMMDNIQSNIEPSNSGRSAHSLSLLQDSIIPSSNVQFKEKVLVWAHRIYSSLLASIEQARRNLLNDQHVAGSQNQSPLYSQPPRRPYPSWSSSQGRDSRFCSTLTTEFRPKGASGNNAQPSQISSNHIRCSSDDYAALIQSLSPYTSSLPGTQTRQRWQSREGSFRSHPSTAHFSYMPHHQTPDQHANSPSAAATHAMDILDGLCEESRWEWTDGMLLNGCLAYGLGDYKRAMKYYIKVLHSDPSNVEAMSNLAATLLALNRRDDAEQYWLRAVKLRPSYFEAIEHLIGLLHEGHRGKEAVKVIEHVEHTLWIEQKAASQELSDASLSAVNYLTGSLDVTVIDKFGSSGYAIPPSDNGRLLALIHGKGNMLYQLGHNSDAAKAFEDAILVGAGNRQLGIRGLIKRIMTAFSQQPPSSGAASSHEHYSANEPILLPPERALETSKLVFPSHGRLPGLEEVPEGFGQKAAVSIISNSLLSLAKIYQDGMSSSGAAATAPRATSGVQEILALYYLSLSLQPSPSTANNVGILLASVQQSSRAKSNLKPTISQSSQIPGVVPGSGIALALAYYDYGLTLDSRHAHLYTNLGSLFKDIGQLNAAIKMYEKAVNCDGNFDIALANLANAVKDQGKVSDAIIYYRRAVASNPDFAEAVCGLANALNSVCSWTGRGGISRLGSNRDRWHVDERGILYDSKKPPTLSCGWIERVVAIVEKQLHDGESWGRGVLHSIGIEQTLQQLGLLRTRREINSKTLMILKKALEEWAENPWEGAKVVRLIERATKNLVWHIYRHQYIHRSPIQPAHRMRPQLPAALAIPSAPTVLPFHTFTCPLSAKQIRKISQRNGLRVSCSTLRAPWLSAQVFDPPSPPNPHLNVGYVSSDFNNHPLAHLMQSVFGFHDRNRVKAFCYATTASDGSVHRQQIEREAPVFHDASLWSIDRLVNQVVSDGIHILINLNGYTRGAKNEVFAARPVPVQMSFMGFAGTLGAEWCDYLLADTIAVPPQTLRPWRGNVDLIDQTKDGNNDDDQDEWVYGENIIFTKDTFFCCDHRQSAPDSQETQLSWPEEQRRRWKMRKELFPDLSDDTVIFGNFNQLYKV